MPSEAATTAKRRLGHLDNPEVRDRYGKYLIRAAWAIEVIAASIGLFIALATIFATQNDILKEQRSVDAEAWLNIFIAALPFFMVAIVELMKIPLATAYYLAQSRVWRWVFLTALLFLIVVTFETMINGFQRQFESRVFLITKDRAELTNVDESIVRLDSRIEELREITVEKVRAEHEAELEQIRSNLDTEIRNLENLRREKIEQAGLTETTTQQSEISRIQSQIAQLRSAQADEIRDLQKSYDADASRSVQDAEAQRKIFENQLSSINQQIFEKEKQRRNEIDGCFFSCDAVREDFHTALDKLENQKNSIRENIAKLSSAGSGQNLRSELDSRINAVRDRYERQIAEQDNRAKELAKIIDDRNSRSMEKNKLIVEQIDERRREVIANASSLTREAGMRFRERLVEIDNREQKVVRLQDEKNGLEKRRTELRNQINLRTSRKPNLSNRGALVRT